MDGIVNAQDLSPTTAQNVCRAAAMQQHLHAKLDLQVLKDIRIKHSVVEAENIILRRWLADATDKKAVGKKRGHREDDDDEVSTKKATGDIRHFAKKFTIFGRLWMNKALSSGVLAMTSDDPDFQPEMEYESGMVNISVFAKAVHRDAAPFLKDGWDELICTIGFWSKVRTLLL